MRDIRGCGGVRSGTYAGLIGEKTSLDTEYKAGTRNTSEDCLEIEGIGKDFSEHSRNVTDIENKNNQRYSYIEEPHERNDDLGQPHDSLAASEKAVTGQKCKDGTDNERGDDRVIPAVCSKCRLKVIGAKQIKSECVRCDQENREQSGGNRGVHGKLNVVSRAAIETAVLVNTLKDLRKGGFHVSGSRTDDAHDPHPENRTGTAKADSSSNADDIARSDAGCSGDHESLE